MVKNTTGGNRAKGYARKNLVKGSGSLRISEDPLEIYVQVSKILGGGNCTVVDLNNEEFLCHIPGKFKGRGKRDNFIATYSWLLVGLREWEKSSDVHDTKKKKRNCDVIAVYSDTDKLRLKNTIVSIDWKNFIANDNKMMGQKGEEDSCDVEFIGEQAQEYQDLIKSQLIESAQAKASITEMSDEDNWDDGEINVDDI
jgi:hypothetical protein